MNQAAKIKRLTAAQLDTVACAHAADGNFSAALETAKKNASGARGAPDRELLFRQQKRCPWDEEVSLKPNIASDAEMVEWKIRKDRYHQSVRQAKAAVAKTPPDINAGILACQVNEVNEDLHQCRRELGKELGKTTHDRFTECERFEKDKSVADRCYNFYFELMGGEYPIVNCRTALCKQKFCHYRKAECESK